MEIILAIVVASAVVFFGALISIGNERQKKAIDNLHEQITLWAIQDLKIKRQRLARDVRVDDPINWLNKIASKVCGFDLNLKVVEVFEEPRTLVCISGEDASKVVFSPHSPNEIHRMNNIKRSRLSQITDRNPLWTLRRKSEAYEFTALNVDISFDLELSIAWKELTGQAVQQMSCIWIYFM